MALAASEAGAEFNPWIGMARDRHFHESDEIAGILKRALFYARAGVPIHFRGPAGLGKTSLATAVAARLGRPVSIMAGHDWLDAGDMIGREIGQTAHAVVDKYIQRVRRSETRVRADWQQSILATAMRDGHTLIYDEFTRASAKANGILLSVLEEGVLLSTDGANHAQALQAHRQFRIVLTSNAHDYAGVNTAPDALLDRMVTFNLGPLSTETQGGIVAKRTGLDAATSRRIVQLVDDVRRDKQSGGEGSMRAAILIARIAAARLRDGPLSDALLAQIATDVLNGQEAMISPADVAKRLKAMT